MLGVDDMREASIQDIEYVAECFVNIARYIKTQASDIYIDNLPDIVDKKVLELAESYINDPGACVFIVESENKPVACIVARIEDSSFSPSDIGSVGNIAICWVDQEHRAKKIAKMLVKNTEAWLLNCGVDVVELSYLAQNSLAEMAWEGLGYVPFRVFSYKELNKHNI